MRFQALDGSPLGQKCVLRLPYKSTDGRHLHRHLKKGDADPKKPWLLIQLGVCGRESLVCKALRTLEWSHGWSSHAI